jgi:hypothetical protein
VVRPCSVVNPTLTVIADAIRVTEHIAGRLTPLAQRLDTHAQREAEVPHPSLSSTAAPGQAALEMGPGSTVAELIGPVDTFRRQSW